MPVAEMSSCTPRAPCPTLLFLAALLAGCSFDYSAASLSDELSESVPDYEIFTVRQQIVRDGGVLLVIDAESARWFADTDTQELDGVTFRELDSDGSTRSEGTAGQARVNATTEALSLSGGVVFRSLSDDRTITAEALDWDPEAETLTAPPETEVSVAIGDGNRVSGVRFSANLRTQNFVFAGPVTGEFTDADETNDSEQADQTRAPEDSGSTDG